MTAVRFPTAVIGDPAAARRALHAAWASRDPAALRAAALGRSARWVLHDAGVDPEWLRRVHAPIGLDIGAVSPEEIAVAILAELIAVRRGRMADPQAAALSLQWTAPRLSRGTPIS